MPNIADVMLNKRIDEYASLTWGDVAEADQARVEHLKGIVDRGLLRCYPNMTQAERDQILWWQVHNFRQRR